MWYKEAIGYQIYPRSFNDTNGDGIGDLNGIREKLDHFTYLGIDLLWLGPIYKSPMDDNGYDVSDFFDIADEYGTLDDFKALLKEAHDRGIKIVLDLVLNHTSDEHPWFIESRKSKENKYRDYYIWQPPRYINGVETEPTNWASFFGGSCWQKDEATNEYYMKIFSNKMPDLNYECEEMRQELYDMVDWWCKLGVDGFRVDAVSHLERAPFEDSTMEVEDARGEYIPDWKKFSNLPKIYTYLEELNSVVKKYDTFMVGEVGGGASLEDALKFVSYEKNRLDMVFTFDHNFYNDGWNSLCEKFEKKIDLEGLKQAFARFQNGLQGKSWHALYWLNHDHPRVMSNYGDVNYHTESGKMLATTLYFMWGTPFIYNGEEIGMTNGDFRSIEDYRDVAAHNSYHHLIKTYPKNHVLTHLGTISRDHSRTPIQWDSSANAGFTTGTPWMKVNDNYSWLNVESQKKDPNSILNYYKKLIKIRKQYKETVLHGKFNLLESNLFAYERIGDAKLLVVTNFSDKEMIFEHKYSFSNVILHNYDSLVLKNDKLVLRPYEAIVFEVK